MLWKALVPIGGTCLLTAAVASAAEFTLEFDAQPSFALAGPGLSDMSLARYGVGGFDIELSALGSGFGEVDPNDVPPGGDIAAFVDANGFVACGNQDDCEPYIASFSVALDAVGVDFIGVGDFSGGEAEIFTASYFLEAWSGPDGTGTLLAQIGDPGGTPLIPRAGGGFLMPSCLSLVAPGIRSIVFGAEAVTDIEDPGNTHNLSIVERLHLTTVPEPSTAALLALGVIGLAARARTRD
jgi:hypothetical protein